MLDKFKKLRQLKTLQDELKKEKQRVQKQGIEVVINGKMEVEEIRLSPSLTQDQQEQVLRQCLNEAIRKIQVSMAQKLSQMPGLGLPK